MAHVGEKMALSPVGTFCLELGVMQFLRQFFDRSLLFLLAPLPDHHGPSGCQQQDQLCQSKPDDVLILAE
jgi:hypothetical protein